jgi:hypothetical protein
MPSVLQLAVMSLVDCLGLFFMFPGTVAMSCRVRTGPCQTHSVSATLGVYWSE